jgi:hypothetical protein
MTEGKIIVSKTSVVLMSLQLTRSVRHRLWYDLLWSRIPSEAELRDRLQKSK